MKDFSKLSPKEFINKYSAFQEKGKITRIMVRTGNSIEETLVEIKKGQPDFIGISLIASSNYPEAIKLGLAIKEKFPDIKLIYGGQHLSSEHKSFLEENSWVDHIIIGDAVEVIEDLIDDKRKEQIIYGGSTDMKNFPLLDPAIIEENNYPFEPTYAYSSSGRKIIDFMFSKGCFCNCEVCIAGSQKKRITSLEEDSIDYQLALFKSYGI